VVDQNSSKKYMVSMGDQESGFMKAGGIFKSDPMNELGTTKFSCQINFMRGEVNVVKTQTLNVVEGTKIS